MNYWYIWVKVYEDDKYIGSYMYHKGYKHKSSAERRARTLWGLPHVDLMTGTIVTRKCIISQTNPWTEEENRYDTARIP
jgi:hypothetical protein